MAQVTRLSFITSLTALALLALPIPDLAVSPAEAQTTKTVWSIWRRNVAWQPCGDFNFTLSLYPHGYMQNDGNGIPYQQNSSYPYDAGHPITVIGWSITQQLSDNNAIGSWVAGSGHGGDGADVFAGGGGVGTNHSRGFFPPGTGVPQGGTAWINTRFDVYGKCNTGMQMFDAVIFYTSP